MMLLSSTKWSLRSKLLDIKRGRGGGFTHGRQKGGGRWGEVGGVCVCLCRNGARKGGKGEIK